MGEEQQEQCPIHQPHDKGYKFLLSSKRVFLELLHSFVDRDWVDRIGEEHLTQVDKSYILQDFREKESDLVYQAAMNGRHIIFFVLMEMQSSVDFQMPYRLLLYMTEIWRDFLKNTASGIAARKDFRLPVIVPIVLYNGESEWTASRSFRETLREQEWFGDEVLDFKYILVNVHGYSDEELKRLSNLIGTVFLLDKQRDVESFIRRMQESKETFRRLAADSLPLLQTWLRMVASKRVSVYNKDKLDEMITEMAQSEEGPSMEFNIEKVFDKFYDELEAKALEQGLELVAEKMLKKGMDFDTIIEVTGLSKERLEKLKK